MQFKLSTVVAFLLVFLTGQSLAYNQCYTGGMRWSDIGNDSEVDGALGALCDMFEGTHQQISETVSNCVNLNGDHIVGSIRITDGPAGGVDLTSGSCLELMQQVKQRCLTFGGELEGIEHNEANGGSSFTATVRADPQSGYDSSCLGD